MEHQICIASTVLLIHRKFILEQVALKILQSVTALQAWFGCKPFFCNVLSKVKLNITYLCHKTHRKKIETSCREKFAVSHSLLRMVWLRNFLSQCSEQGEMAHHRSVQQALSSKFTENIFWIKLHRKIRSQLQLCNYDLAANLSFAMFWARWNWTSHICTTKLTEKKLKQVAEKNLQSITDSQFCVHG